ncbi:Glutamate receptor [Rhynchospora pubera]|uniref:Glutamate receptor n=1 Tax=Rhynchospora pubera TaxID=906938 RepID=A0AAV8HS75_9POAL|nr:Glutamate receptor [Rhynchospora pubera]
MPSSFITGPFTFQISYSEAALVRCLADFVKLHRWRLVITIYENDALGWVSNTNLLLEDALRANGSKIEYHAIFQPQNSLSDWEKTVEAELRQMMQYESTVYIVLQSSEGLALSLFKKALELNLISPRYTWICSNDITDLFNSTLPPTFIANNMQGVIGIKSYINESAEYKDFSSKFQKMFISDYGKNDENFYNPGVYAVRAYDALHAISLASNESKMKNTSLAEALSLVNFQGLSGTIVPTNHTINNMEMKLSYYEIFGIVGRNSANLGFWHDDFGFNPDMKNISSLYKLPGNQPSGLRPLKVGIPAKPVWKNFVNVNTTINCISAVDNSAVTGFCVDVFIEALNFLKYNVSYHFFAYTTERNSSCKVTKYNDLVNLVNSQEVDLVVGDVTILASRSKNVSFTQPFLTSEIVMLVPTENTHIGWLSVKPFSRNLWICIVCILFCYIFLVWLLERDDGEADEDFDGPIWMQIAASVWILSNSIFLKIDQGVGSYHTKIVLLWWFLLVQVLLSSFTASLSSILVTEKLPLSVNNLKIGCSAESFVYDYLKSTLNYKTENLVKIDTADEFTYAFDRKIITAAYLELPYLRVFLSEHKNYAVNGESRTLGGFGFVFPDGSPLRDDFSKAILRLHENGRIMALQRKWFNVSLSSSPYPVKPNKTKSLGLQNFEYLFIIFTGFAILTTLHKFIHKWWTSQTNHTEL